MTAHHPWLKHSPQVIRGALDAASWDAAALWQAVQLYMADTGTDGSLPKVLLPAAVSRRLSAKSLAACTAELCSPHIGLWVDEGDLVRSTHWEQPPVDVWTDDVKRHRWQRAKALFRDSSLCRAVKDRDRNLCRYCGERVNWMDKRSKISGTYDHVDPDGENLLSNVVVACRKCNGTKKDRTPEQAGMPLYLAGTTAADIAAGSARTVAASAVPRPVPEPRARTGDSNRIQIGFNSGPSSARAPARDRTESNRAKSDLDRTAAPSTAGRSAGSHLSSVPSSGVDPVALDALVAEHEVIFERGSRG